MKKTFRILMTLMAVLLALTACSAPADTAKNGQTSDTVYKIGVIQYAPHPSLDNCYTGILAGLEESGLVIGENLTIDFQNAMGDMANSDLMAKNMAAARYDMIIGIATPAAMSAYAAAKEDGIPVIFCAVSDPVGAGLAESLEKPNTGATGTKDALNFEGQLAMIRAFLPKADTIGILYTVSEPNSVSHLAEFERLAPSYGFTIESVGINNASDVATGAAALVAKGVDCVNNFTDNNVVDNLSTLLHATDGAGIPVFGSEVTQVTAGCLASETLDYVALGRETGLMAVKVLKGEGNVKALPISVIVDSTPVYNAAVAEKFSIVLPAAYAEAPDVQAVVE